MTFCGECFLPVEDIDGMTSNSSLDFHILHVHGRNPNKENGTATLEANGIKPSPYKAQIPFTFRRSP